MVDKRAMTTGTNCDFSMRLSWPMQRVLNALLNGNDVSHHCRKMSDYGGLVSTLAGLRRRGLIGFDNKLTEAGRTLARHLANGN